MHYLETLHWRYATKRMNVEKKIASATLQNILEAIRLAPTSLGIQPFEVLVIQDAEMKKALQPACANQPQIVECDTLLVFVALKEITEQHIQNYIANIATTRGVDLSSLDGMKNIIKGYVSANANSIFEWSKRQAYLALGFGLMACSLEKIDSTPMEGFNADQVNAVLNIDTKQKGSTVLLALGHRDEKNDYLVDKKKVRKSAEHIFTILK